MKIESFDAEKHPAIQKCKWQLVRETVERDCPPCQLRFVVIDHGRQDGFCKHHLAIEMEENVRLRAALLVQLADRVLQ